MRSGWTLRWEVREHRVDDTISWGRALIETIFLGADWRLMAQSLEYSASGLTEMIWPWNDLTDDVVPEPVTTLFTVNASGISERATNRASGNLMLSAVAGTPAALSPATLSAAQAVSGNGMFGMDSRNRESPVEMRLLPYTFSSNSSYITRWFETS